jgi:hypothetical protein
MATEQFIVSVRAVASAFTLSILLLGCSITKQPLVIAPPGNRAGIALPVELRNYAEVYAFIAKHEGIPAGADFLFQLAADSEIEIRDLEGSVSFVWVVTPHFYNGGVYDKIRGVQGNGGIYVLRPPIRDLKSDSINHGFELIGVAEGNVWRFSTVNQVPRLLTHWHVSADEHSEDAYDWNGKFFERSNP